MRQSIHFIRQEGITRPRQREYILIPQLVAQNRHLRIRSNAQTIQHNIQKRQYRRQRTLLARKDLGPRHLQVLDEPTGVARDDSGFEKVCEIAEDFAVERGFVAESVADCFDEGEAEWEDAVVEFGAAGAAFEACDYCAGFCKEAGFVFCEEG